MSDAQNDTPETGPKREAGPDTNTNVNANAETEAVTSTTITRPRPRRRKIRPLILAVALLVLAGAATLTWVMHRESQVQHNVYGRIMERNLSETQKDFREFLRPFPSALHTLQQWHEAGELQIGNPDALAKLIVPLVDPTPQIAQVCLVPMESGAEAVPVTVLHREGDTWRTITDAETAAACRQSHWFVKAVTDTAALGTPWSDYIDLPVMGGKGLVAAERSGDLVLSVGLAGADLDTFATTVPITENGILVRLYDTGHVAWLTPQYGSRLIMSPLADIYRDDRPEPRTISVALGQWAQHESTYEESFQFEHAGQTWWCIFYPSEAEADPGELGLIVPAGDLHYRLESANDQVTILLFGIVALAVLAVVLLAFDYRSKWLRFAHRRRPTPETPAQLAELLAGGESHYLEFKQTMRWNLHRNKPGKEMEVAWLKSVVAFLNTDGGHIALGVADDGEVTGLEADDFKNDDILMQHFDNLIQQHVGLELARYIHADLQPIDDKRILLITCDRCEEPAFLTNGAKEEFYIRIGASSRTLPASKIIDYMRERQG